MVRLVLKCMLCVVITLSVTACGREEPEQQLRAAIAAMQKDVEEGKAGDFMDGVASDFVGNEGVDRAGLERLVKAQLLLNNKVGVQTGPVTVELAPDNRTATVRFSVLLVGGSGRFMPERGDMQELVSGWREEGGEWKVYSASWRAAGR